MGKWMGDENPHTTIFNISFGYLVPTKQQEDAIKKEKKKPRMGPRSSFISKSQS